MSNGRQPIVTTSQACQRIKYRLRGGPLTPEQISERAFVSINTLTKGGYLRAMEAAGIIYVLRWKPPARSGMWTPVWALGAGVSVPHPRRQSNAEYVSRWRRKNGLTAAVQRKSAMKSAPTASLASMLGVSP